MVMVTGEIDLVNAGEFAESVVALAQSRPAILDVSRLSYIDSAGFAALDRLLADRVVVVVLSPDSPIHKAAELIELPFHHDADAARRVLGQPPSLADS